MATQSERVSEGGGLGGSALNVTSRDQVRQGSRTQEQPVLTVEACYYGNQKACNKPLVPFVPIT